MADVDLSVVVPCFDLERYVVECLDSLAPIGRGGGELIVVDDASHDASASLVAEWAEAYDGSCRTVFHEANRGAPAAFNSGLAAASKPLLCFVDADDTAESTALSRQARLLADGPEEVVAVYGDIDRVDEAGEPLPGPTGGGDAMLSLLGEHFTGDVRTPLVERGSVCPLLGTVVRTADVRRVGGFDETLRFCDWPLWLKLAPLGRFVFSGETVGSYRQHAASMSRQRRDQLDQDRLRLLVGLARDPAYEEQRSAIAGRLAQLTRAMAERGNRPPLRPSLGAALTLRNPRLAAQVVRAGSVRSLVSTVPPDESGRPSS